METKKIRIHRLGAVTFGIVLVLLGVVCLLRVILPALDFGLVIRFWPLVLIILGVEVLLGNRQKTYEVLDDKGQVVEQDKVIYDVPAIMMMFAALFFTLLLAWADWAQMNHYYF